MTAQSALAAAAPRWGFWASLRFWLGVAVETITRRRFARVLERRLRGRAIVATGVEHVPRERGFVLCLNHYHAGLTLDVVSAALLAATRARADVSAACTVLVGQRAVAEAAPSRWQRLLRRAAGAFFRRWRANVLRIPTGRGAVGIAELRAWRKRTAERPTLVFPEGAANRELGTMREGAGRWLAGLDVPVLPVGVWWAGNGWEVAIGAPIAWSPRRDLRDLQLGLAIADLLPEELAPAWSGVLAAWRAAHASVVVPRRERPRSGRAAAVLASA